MKIAAILGSPKKNGNTAKVLSMFEEKVGDKHEVERIHITEYKVGGCLGCYKCREKKDEPGCVQKDDGLILFEKMIQADAIVYASPLYCWSFSSQLKPLIDRHVCLVSDYGTADHDSLISGKPAALLVTCAGPIAGNCDPIQGIFARHYRPIQRRMQKAISSCPSVRHPMPSGMRAPHSPQTLPERLPDEKTIKRSFRNRG